MWQLPIPSCHIYQLAEMAAYDHKADVYYDNNNDTNYETCLFGVTCWTYGTKNKKGRVNEYMTWKNATFLGVEES